MAEGEKTEQKAGIVRYDRQEALERARKLTGESRHVMAGALATDTEHRESWTENQLKKLVADFVKRVAVGHEEEPVVAEEATAA